MSTQIDHNEVLDRLKSHFGVKSDTALAHKLGTKQSTISNWRSRETLNYELIITKCVDADLNWIFLGLSPSRQEQLVAMEPPPPGTPATQDEDGSRILREENLKLKGKVEVLLDLLEKERARRRGQNNVA